MFEYSLPLPTALFNPQSPLKFILARPVSHASHPIASNWHLTVPTCWPKRSRNQPQHLSGFIQCMERHHTFIKQMVMRASRAETSGQVEMGCQLVLDRIRRLQPLVPNMLSWSSCWVESGTNPSHIWASFTMCEGFRSWSAHPTTGSCLVALAWLDKVEAALVFPRGISWRIYCKNRPVL